MDLDRVRAMELAMLEASVNLVEVDWGEMEQGRLEAKDKGLDKEAEQVQEQG
ncbi:hypothetical protein D3C81_2256950 [compost metagenome]